MLRLTPAPPEGGAPRRVLALGCHSDDIEIGCGGTLLRLAREEPGLEVWWVVFSGIGDRGREARESAAAFLEGVRESNVIVHEFRDGFFPVSRSEIKEYFEEIKRAFTPDLILTHYRHDLHQDHRLVNELTWNTFRNHLVLEYEVPKYDGDLGIPNVYVELPEDVCRRKVELLDEHFGTQRSKHWFGEDLFLSLMRIRGMESASPTRYAEAYHGRKIAL